MSSSIEITRTPRVLSIQSHTTHGFVGNKAATFPLQTMGFDVDCINSVSLSNHPAYSGGCKGTSLDSKDLEKFVEGLENNNLLDYDVLVTGYNRSPELLSVIEETVKKIKSVREDVIYVCDPVLGDNGKYYVPEELCELYKTKIFPLSFAITPNIFEAEELSGIKIKTFQDAIVACKTLHSFGPKICFLTGLRLSSNNNNKEEENKEEELSIIASIKTDQDMSVFRVNVPLVQGHFSGCGDLFSALVTAGLHHYRHRLSNTDNHHHLGDLMDLSCLVVGEVLSLTKQRDCKEIKVVESRESYRNMINQLLIPVNRNSNNKEFLSNFIPSSFIASSNKVVGIIFDMDGTLTEPGAIDFLRMYERIGFEKDFLVDDIIAQIRLHFPSEEDRKRAFDIVEEEEMFGCERMTIRPNLTDLMVAAKVGKVRTAIATRNIEKAYHQFLQKSNLGDQLFYPTLFRDSLGINKPDPRVAKSIMDMWEINPAERSNVWFVGDSIDDMKCGKLAGCSTCLVSTTYNKNYKKEYPELVDLVVDNLMEFGKFINLPTSNN